MQKLLKISIIQTDIIWENKEANLACYDKILEGIDNDTDIVVFPELFTTGFSMSVSKLAEDADGKTINWMKSSASRCNFILAGSIIFKADQKFLNRFIWMNPSGSFLFYDKRHLFRMGRENEHYSNGKKKLVVGYKGWKICPLICYDLRFPVWSRNAAGYHVLIYVANWPSQRSFAWNTLLRARAIENQCYVIGVNRVGKDGNETEYIGESVFLDPKGFNVKTVQTSKGEIFTAVLDMDILNDQRKRFPVLKDADIFKVI